MEVMECWDNVMSVKVERGCVTKPYDHFEIITDLSPFKIIHKSRYFEDHRSPLI